MKDQELVLELAPLIPSYLIGENKEIHATFLGHVEVIYQLKEKKDYIPGEYTVEEITLKDQEQNLYRTNSSYLNASMVEDIRNGRIRSITVVLK